MRLLLFALALFCAIFSLCGTASAVLVDWSALSWPAGSLSNSYDVDPASPGNDVTVTVTVNFSALYAQGVTNVRLQLFDVDFASSPGNSGANFQDQIRSISALSI